MSAFPVPTVHTLAELRERVAQWRARGERVGFVPTMGALHEGHLSLVEEARRRARRVIVSVFVNPTQFSVGEDFERYPRTLPADIETLARVDADLCYAPALEEMYPPGFVTAVTVGGPAVADLEDGFGDAASPASRSSSPSCSIRPIATSPSSARRTISNCW